MTPHGHRTDGKGHGGVHESRTFVPSPRPRGVSRRNRAAAPSHPCPDCEGRPERNQRHKLAPPPQMARGRAERRRTLRAFALSPMAMGHKQKTSFGALCPRRRRRETSRRTAKPRNLAPKGGGREE